MTVSLRKIERRVEEIGKSRYAESLTLSNLKAELQDSEEGEVVYLSEGVRWGKRDSNYIVSFEVEIPAAWQGQTLALNLNLSTPHTHSLSTIEGLLFLDGEPYHALDRYHREIVLPPEKTGQPRLGVVVKLWTGIAADYHDVSKLELVRLNAAADALFLRMSMAVNAVKVLDENAPTRDALLVALDAACQELDFRQPNDINVLQKSCEKALAVLEKKWKALELENTDWQPNVIATGHAHIDVAWLWRLKHVRLKAANTFSSVVYHMDRYKHFTFIQSQPRLYQYVKEDQPALYERIKEKVKAGQWEPEGAMWVEADTNLTGAESLVRQFLFGQRFFRQEFGVTSKVLWLPDVFGYSAAVPQLIKGAGADYFITTKISWNETNRIPVDTFWWKGLDGTKVLTYFITAQNDDHSWNFYTYNGEMRPEALYLSWKNYRHKELNREMLLAYGYGDGGGGPTRSMVEAAGLFEHAITPDIPTSKTGFVSAFMDRLAERVGNNPELPEWSGELYLEYHRGTYTSQGFVKWANRKAEEALHNVELLAATALSLTGEAYPKDDLDTAWKVVLTHQFHDIIPGSSIGEVYVDARVNYAEVFGITDRLLASAEKTLAAKVAAPADSLVVFNPLGWARRDIVEIEQAEAAKLSLPVQNIDGGKALVQVEGVPSFGYQTFTPGATAASPTNTLSVSPSVLENGSYRIELDEMGQIPRLLDKAGYGGKGREVLLPGQKGNIFQFFEDKPVDFDAWNIDPYFEQKMYGLEQTPAITVIEQGPLRAGLRLEWFYQGRSRITQNLYIYAGSRRIDFVTEVDWHERQTLLKVAFPVDVRNDHATADIQFGNVERPTHRNTSWDRAKYETCAHKWFDLSEGDYGVAILNDSKYGYDVHKSTMRLSLLRGPIEPDPNGDIGLHQFTYSLFPHAGDWFEGGVYRAGYELNNPLLPVVKTDQAGSTAPEFSLVQATPSNVIIETVKRAEDSDVLVVRLYETANRRGSFELKFAFPIVSAVETNLLEEETGPVEIGGNGQSIQGFIKPFEIKTFLVNLQDI